VARLAGEVVPGRDHEACSRDHRLQRHRTLPDRAESARRPVRASADRSIAELVAGRQPFHRGRSPHTAEDLNVTVLPT
jgi:hypothetical protein